MKERRMRLTNLLIVPELVGVHAAFVVPSDDRSKFVDLAPGHMKLRSCLEASLVPTTMSYTRCLHGKNRV